MSRIYCGVYSKEFDTNGRTISDVLPEVAEWMNYFTSQVCVGVDYIQTFFLPVRWDPERNVLVSYTQDDVVPWNHLIEQNIEFLMRTQFDTPTAPLSIEPLIAKLSE